MKKLLTIMLFVLSAISYVGAEIPIGESLNYRVMYKWGLVNKQAGHVNISTSSLGNGKMHSLLVAATEKWADRIYKVRDTLRGNIIMSTIEPTLYEKITHEGGEYKFDRIVYDRKGDKVTGYCRRLKQKKAGKPIEVSEITLESQGLTIDMLSAFYYMRSIPYASMAVGESREMTVFSGKRKELLTIKYCGTAEIEVDKHKYSTYHIRFRFTGDGGKKTSDDMDAWLSTEPGCIPIKLEGKLPVGKVQCFLIP